MIKRYLLLLLAAAPMLMHAQLTKDATYKVESAVTVSDGETPLWLNANKQGLSSLEKQNGYVRAGVYRPFQEGDGFTYAYGLDLVGAVNFSAKVIVQQAYLDFQYKKMMLSIGSKERLGELVNNNLSSGALTLSGNARPIPQVWAGLPEYIKVPFTKGWLSFRGHIAYGRFADDAWQKDFVAQDGRRTEDVLYHSKALYFKIGDKPNFPLTFEGGMQMETQFGGKIINCFGKGKTLSMPSKIKDYFKALVPMSGGADTPLTEQLNIEGNVVGSWHASLACKLPSNFKIRGYYEHYFEDHSMLFFSYPWKDGLKGLELTFPKNKWVDAIVYEHMGSKDQSGAFSWWGMVKGENMEVYGLDNYYNHGIYNAWQHAGQTLGNPLFTSPIYNKDKAICFKSNRIIAHHIGAEGSPTKELHYRMLCSYSSNWGTYSIPFDDVKYNTSILTEITYRPEKMQGWGFSAALAVDRGTLLGNNIGGMIKVCKTGLLTKCIGR